MKQPSTEQQSAIPPTVLTQLQLKMGELQKALLEKDPQMPNHLRESHRLLITYPETVHLLDDEEIAQLIEAAKRHTNTEIIKETSKSKSGGSKKKFGVDDL